MLTVLASQPETNQMNNPFAHSIKNLTIALVAFAALLGRLQATTVIEDTFSRTGALNNSTTDSGQTWIGSGWTTNGSEVSISGGTASRIGSLTLATNTHYVLSMDVNVMTGGTNGSQDWIGFGFTTSSGNVASSSRGFMLHRRTAQVQFFSSGTNGAQSAPSTSPFPNSMEIHLTTGANLANSTLSYKLNGVVVGNSVTTDASPVDSVFVGNISNSTGTVDNFVLTANPIPGTDSFPGFSMNFVEIGEAGNADDNTGNGAVGSPYRIAKYEVSRSMIDAYNLNSGGPTLTMADMTSYNANGGDRPATGISWNEAARFVNWLNTSQGHAPAYKFTTNGGNDDIALWTSQDSGYDPTNAFRNSNAFYFLPSEDEWYKAAYFDPALNGGSGGYWDYPTGSDSFPSAVANGTTSGTAVYSQSGAGEGPADIFNAGGLSALGTTAQGGNAREWTESGFTQPNDSATEIRVARGGYWLLNEMNAGVKSAHQRTFEFEGLGFRVASILAPEIAVENSLGTDLASTLSTQNFGSLLLGDTSPPETFTICNNGSAPLTGLVATLSGSDTSEFALNTNLTGTTLAPGECITVEVTYTPTTESSHTATLEIASNDADENPFLINLIGSGVTPYLIAQQACLTGNAPDFGDEYGYSVAISEDGSTVVVGAYNEDSASTGINGDESDNSRTDSGAVYVYSRSGGTLTQQAYLKASNAGVNDAFGWSVDIWDDTIVVGAYREESGIAGINVPGAGSDNSVSLAGAAYVFQRTGTTWSEQAYLKSPDPGLGDRFGYSVAISNERIAVGSPLEDSGTNDPTNNSAGNSGAVFLFKRLVGVWSTDDYLKASNLQAGDEFGFSVALDSNLLVVGAPLEDSNLSGNENDNSVGASGAAYVFENNSGWSQIAYLKANNPDIEDLFGWSVSIAADTVLVGAPQEDSNATGVDGDESNNSALDSGAAYVFRPSGSNWSQTSYLKPNTTDAGDRYGVWVTMTKTTLAVGASLEDSSSVNVNGDESDNSVGASGSVRVYISWGGSWLEKAYLKASEVGSSYTFGQALAISDFGMVVGSRGVRSGPGNTTSGAAYVYDFLPEIKVEEPVGNDLTNGFATVDLGAGLVDSPALTKTITICNEGFGLLSGLSVNVSGPHAGDFVVDSSLLGSQLSPCACRTITVSFTPSGEGSRTATLSIASNDLDENPFEIALTGVGIVPPDIAQEVYFKASNTGNGDQFGCSVSVWENTVAIGAYSEDSDAVGINQDMNNNNTGGSGAVYIYVRDPDNCEWSLQATIKSSNPDSGDSFGGKVSLYGDTLAVGALAEDSSAIGINGNQADNSFSNSGAVYLFVRNGTTWTQQAYVKASNTGDGDRFGEELSLAGDTLVVGAAWEDSSATGVNGDQGDDVDTSTALAQGQQSGAAYVFVRNGNNWTQEAYLKASNTARGDLFGSSVAVSGDTVIVGASGENSEAPGANGLNGDFGAAYIFVRTNGNWNQQASLKASNKGPADRFGTAVALEGDTAVVCAPYEGDSSVDKAGAAYVFTRDNSNNWTEQAYLKASNPGNGDRFGWSASLSGDLLLIGSPYEESQSVGVNGGNQNDDSLTRAGATYLFQNIAGTWTQQVFLKASNTGEDDEFGWSVDIYGSTIFVGAKGEKSNSIGVNSNQSDNSLTVAGAAYLFETPSTASIALAQYDAAVAQAGLIGADALPTAIPFGDGISNLMKYAFNLNLAGPDSQTMNLGGSSGLPWTGIVDINGQLFLQLEYLIRKECVLVYTPQKSTTLLPNSFVPFTGNVTITSIDSNWSRGTILEPVDSTTQSGCFYRVWVEFP
ncbi:MAG: choice-of-anchor D domain-containing protein [Roseibacillus sp.]